MTKAKIVRFFKENIIIKEDNHLDCAYVIVSGTVEVYKKVSVDKIIHIANLGKGQIIGEMSLFGDKVSTASVKAVTDVELQVIDKKIFEEYLAQTPPLIRILIEILVNRLLKTNHKYLISSQTESKKEVVRIIPRPIEIDFKNGKIKE